MAHKTKIRQIIQQVSPVFSFVILIVALVSVFAVTGNFTKVFQQKSASALLTPLPTPAPHTTFTSNNLGISFTYLTQVSGRQNFFTREIGNTVYLYYNVATNQPFSGTDAEFLQTIPGHGYSVEVFSKDPQQSLRDAIKQQFLTGYAESNCFVNTARYGHPRADESYQTAIIDFPHKPGQSRKQLETLVAKCPKYIQSFDSVRYFMKDPKYPGKLLFITIGQGNIPSGVDGGTWDRTIKVLQ